MTKVDPAKRSTFIVRCDPAVISAVDGVKRRDESRNDAVVRVMLAGVISARAEIADRAAAMFDD